MSEFREVIDFGLGEPGEGSFMSHLRFGAESTVRHPIESAFGAEFLEKPGDPGYRITMGEPFLNAKTPGIYFGERPGEKPSIIAFGDSDASRTIYHRPKK